MAFINTHRDVYGVEPICAVLPMAPSTCYEQKARVTDSSRVPPRTQRDAELRAHIVTATRAGNICRFATPNASAKPTLPPPSVRAAITESVQDFL